MAERMTAEQARQVTGWCGMPYWILQTPEIGASAKFVAMLVHMSPGETPERYSEWQDIPPDAVRKGLNDLWSIGVIEVRDGRAYPKPSVVGISDSEE